MTRVLDRDQKFRLDHFDLLVPDGQLLRWALNALHLADLPDGVYGPNLTLRICAKAAAEARLVFFYGSLTEILKSRSCLSKASALLLMVAGMEPFTRSAS
jgi:UDP-N-acetyl-D-mannosaminuronic acid transferase (WecB/TagA/CpsF family)